MKLTVIYAFPYNIIEWSTPSSIYKEFKSRGYKTIAQLPAYKDLALYHPKTIERQEKQNNFYNTL